MKEFKKYRLVPFTKQDIRDEETEEALQALLSNKTMTSEEKMKRYADGLKRLRNSDARTPTPPPPPPQEAPPPPQKRKMKKIKPKALRKRIRRKNITRFSIKKW